MLTSETQLQHKTHFIFFQIDITIQKNFSLPAGVTLGSILYILPTRRAIRLEEEKGINQGITIKKCQIFSIIFLLQNFRD